MDTMQFYKKVLLTLSGVAILASCASLKPQMTLSVSGKVIKIEDFIYLDLDDDGSADARMYIRGYTVKNNQCYFKDYLMVGDTLKYRTTKDNPCNLDADLYLNVILDSINSRSASDLVRIHQINFMRRENGQEEMR